MITLRRLMLGQKANLNFLAPLLSFAAPFLIAALVNRGRVAVGFPFNAHRSAACHRQRHAMIMSSSSSDGGSLEPGKEPACAEGSSQKSSRRALYPFYEARRIARGHGFSSKEEFLEYSCPGAYQLPKNPHEIWKDDGWNGWDDFLGVPFSSYEEAKIVVKANLDGIASMEDYVAFMRGLPKSGEGESEMHSLIVRLPYRPDKFYKSEWKGWDDWLGLR